MSLKPIVLHSAGPSANPWKVAILLAELGIPYETKIHTFQDLKEPAYEKINPNGRAPSIEDPNTGITLWESGAILEYIIATYDKDHKFSFAAGTPEDFYTKQWLFFQVSGQGPYYGQAVWFQMFHPEHVPSATERYKNEIKRVTGVLDKHLAGKKFLVSDKLTYADISFLPWQQNIYMVWQDGSFIPKGEFPNVDAWVERIASSPATAKVIEERAELVKKFYGAK